MIFVQLMHPVWPRNDAFSQLLILKSTLRNSFFKEGERWVNFLYCMKKSLFQPFEHFMPKCQTVFRTGLFI
jgi:hypothetical protein